jgi:uncharacterized RDD family membrane protein YckC
LYCGKCGAEIPAGADSCRACGKPVTPSGDDHDLRKPTGQKTTARVAYAGFWLRLVAFTIDLFIVGIGVGIIIIGPLLKNIAPGASLRELWAFYTSGTRQALAVNLLVQMANWLYFASFESSLWQATPGKRALGIFVTDLAGNRITFARASGRYFGKLLSEFIFFFGFIMAGFTQRKQALHDQIAGCLVLRRF